MVVGARTGDLSSARGTGAGERAVTSEQAGRRSTTERVGGDVQPQMSILDMIFTMADGGGSHLPMAAAPPPPNSHTVGSSSLGSRSQAVTGRHTTPHGGGCGAAGPVRPPEARLRCVGQPRPPPAPVLSRVPDGGGGEGVGGEVEAATQVALKALVWFWIIDETLVLTSILSVCRLNEFGTCQVMEQVMIMMIMVMTTR